MDNKKQEKLENKKLVFAIAIVAGAILLPIILNHGEVTELQSIKHLFYTISFVFVLSLGYVLYFKQNYKTLAFWVSVVISILFVVCSVLYYYLITSTSHL